MEAIGRCCRNAYVQPFERQKVIYVCGAVIGACIVVLVILIVSLFSSSSSSTPVTPTVKGSDALKSAPLIVGFNNLPQNLKTFKKNQVSGFDFKKGLGSSCTACQTDYPTLSSGKVAAQIWSVNIDCTAEYKDAVSQSLEQIDLIQRFISLNPSTLDLATNATGITKIFEKNSEVIGSIIGVNGGHSIDNRLGVLRMFYQLGVRVMAITSSCSLPWAFSSSDVAADKDTGLNDFGEKVVAEMNRVGIVIDLSGSSDVTQLEVLNITKAPVIFSHSAVSALNSGSKTNINDNVLLKLKENKGIIMLTFVPSAFNTITPTNVSSVDIIKHLEYIRNKIGSEYIGIGGAYDVESKYPIGLGDISNSTTLFDSLYSDYHWKIDELENLAGKNFLRVLKKVEEVRDSLAKGIADETWENKADIPESSLSCYTDFNIR